MNNILIKQSWHCLSYPSIYLFVQPVYERWIQRRHIPPTSENLRAFLNLCTNSIIKCNFCTSTWNNLYVLIGSTHHTPNPVIYIPLVSSIQLILWLLCCYVRCKFHAWYHFLLFKNEVFLQLLGDAVPRPPTSEIYSWNINSSFHKSLNLP